MGSHSRQYDSVMGLAITRCGSGASHCCIAAVPKLSASKLVGLLHQAKVVLCYTTSWLVAADASPLAHFTHLLLLARSARLQVGCVTQHPAQQQAAHSHSSTSGLGMRDVLSRGTGGMLAWFCFAGLSGLNPSG
jgi:hypothetical protein